MEGLAFGLIEWLITGAVSGFCGLSLGGIWYLKGKVEDAKEKASGATEDVRDEFRDQLKQVRDDVHELEKKLIAEYASKADLREVVRESLAPLKETMGELKSDLRATIAAIDGYKRWGPPE